MNQSAYYFTSITIQANSKSADPKDIQVTEKDNKTANGEVEINEVESLSSEKGEPMEIDVEMQTEGESSF